MFKSIDLSLIVEFMLMFYKDKPIDWLLDHIMWVKVCNPEKDAVSSPPPSASHLQMCTCDPTPTFLPYLERYEGDVFRFIKLWRCQKFIGS